MAAQRTVLHSRIFNDTVRKWQSVNTEITPYNLMYPVFLVDKDDAFEEIPSIPEVYRLGINRLIEFLEPAIKNGLKSVLLFGVLSELEKDDRASNADSLMNPVIRAIPLLKRQFPDLTIACDVCLCPYISHGHCAVLLDDGSIDNNCTINRLAEIACGYAVAGADIVAPSDMMDNRVGMIKNQLLSIGMTNVGVLSYSAKFASCFYGPFRDAANSAPTFGDRKSYQLPVGGGGIARAAVKRDIEEGCDFLMIKPALSNLDIIRQTKDEYPNHTVFAYQVSGEYAMLYHAAENGAFDLKTAVKETLTSIRRAGADCIVTYYTPQILQWLADDPFDF